MNNTNWINEIVNFFRLEKVKRYLFTIGLIIVIYLSVLSPKLMGFADGHHGWVSSEQLATIVRSTPENGFVGYRMLLNSKPAYFTKGSVIYNAVFNSILLPFKDVSSKLFVARLVTDFIFLLNMFLLFRLIYILTGNWKSTAIAILLGFSGYTALYFRDLIVPDNFLTLSFLLTSFSIYYYKSNKISKSVVFMLIAISLGYVLINTLPYIIWGCFELYNKLKHKTAIKKSVLVILCAGSLSLSFFAYNVALESVLRQVPIEETDIIISANKRAPLTHSEERTRLSPRSSFSAYMPEMIDRLFNKTLIPCNVYLSSYNIILLSTIFLSIVIFSIIQYYLKRPNIPVINEKMKLALIVALVSSCYTFYILKEFTLQHDFARVTLSIAASILWFVIVLSLERFFYMLSIIAIMTFYLANTSQMKKKVDIVNSKEFNIYDMDKINDILHEKEDVDLCIEGGYRSLAKGAPFASGFVLYQYNIVENPQDCDYLLSTKKTKHTLTPNNEFHFLYHKLEKP